MGMGGCIAMIALGAILTFAVDVDLNGIDTPLAGLILMGVGILGLSAYISVFKRRRTQAPSPAAPVVEERHHYDRI
ncbi:hypothetical protein [Streptomyces sp. NPDC018031]|uniref:hypothetical protein n=1 Tax=Streptomyces sp. NPDC018031 TaxID=3365033 RepID=UPI0037A98A88